MSTLLRAGERLPSRPHAPVVALLVAGALLRLVALEQAARAGTGMSLLPLVAVQHLAGLAVAAGVYAVLVRWGVWTWLAALATGPALLDGRVLATEHAVGVVPAVCLATSLVIVALCWKDRPVQAAAPVVATCAAAVLAVAVLAARGVVPFAHPDGVPFGALQPYALDARAPGWTLLVGLAVALAAAVGTGRALTSPLRRPVWVTAGVPVAATVGTVSWHVLAWGSAYPALVWWPAAGALGLTALLRGRRGSTTRVVAEDAVDEAARAAFRERYGIPALAPVVVVIAAYNEAASLPAALAEIPDTVLDLPCDVLVVDDGSTDGTAEVLAATRAHAVACPTNRGQGAALRLGYRLALAHGAEFIITTDADGQYDVADFPVVLAPLLEDRADFVTGSRVLGQQHTRDPVRRLGVHVFAWLASVLVGRRLTDTSFGLRAMRAVVPAVLTLDQPQYQSSELLLGALSRGLRVLEVPGTMHVRGSGATKKGRNVVYGTRYARVVLGTWWREGCPRPAAEVPATVRPRDHVGG